MFAPCPIAAAVTTVGRWFAAVTVIAAAALILTYRLMFEERKLAHNKRKLALYALDGRKPTLGLTFDEHKRALDVRMRAHKQALDERMRAPRERKLALDTLDERKPTFALTSGASWISRSASWRSRSGISRSASRRSSSGRWSASWRSCSGYFLG